MPTYEEGRLAAIAVRLALSSGLPPANAKAALDLASRIDSGACSKQGALCIVCGPRASRRHAESGSIHQFQAVIARADLVGGLRCQGKQLSSLSNSRWPRSYDPKAFNAPEEHCMVQVRVAVLNGELSPDRVSALENAASRHSKCIGPASPNRHHYSAWSSMGLTSASGSRLEPSHAGGSTGGGAVSPCATVSRN
jgi:hypothetical protein